MNATRWVSLSEFVKHLGREGIAHVDEVDNEGEHGWYLTWIDRSPAALSRQDALQKMERAKVDEEGRMRKYLKEQIEKAKEIEQARQVNGDEATKKVEEGLQRGGDAKPLKIGLSRSSDPTSTRTRNAAEDDLIYIFYCCLSSFQAEQQPIQGQGCCTSERGVKAGRCFQVSCTIDCFSSSVCF